ncbi:hypothetical protein CDAR_212941 [Caerostris darwini]|uniref:Uncharacterized protein n=1 Tax=Caerostris darwini TaxID=1538125 RepID=A0AAV4UBH8_9ARAC|nr:hypothetical protein CDAR_212941 [Caerostris darwini]
MLNEFFYVPKTFEAKMAGFFDSRNPHFGDNYLTFWRPRVRCSVATLIYRQWPHPTVSQTSAKPPIRKHRKESIAPLMLLVKTTLCRVLAVNFGQ